MTNKTTSAIDLVPCPFCGSAPKFNTHFAWCSNGHMMVQLPLGSWNTRPEAADTITRLQAALKRIAEMTDIEADFDGFEAREIAATALKGGKNEDQA